MTSVAGCGFLQSPYELRCWERHCVDGSVALRDGQFDTAVEQFRRALSYSGTQARTVLTKYRLAQSLLLAGQPEPALTLFRQIYADSQTLPAVQDTLLGVNALLGEARCQADLGQEAAAKAAFEECLSNLKQRRAAKPGDAGATLLLLSILDETAQYLRSVKDEEQASRLEDEHIELETESLSQTQVQDFHDIVRRAERANDQKDYATALALLEPVIQDNNSFALRQEYKRAIRIVYRIYMKEGRWHKAGDTIEQLLDNLKADPFTRHVEFFEELQHFGHMADKEDNEDLAEAYAKKALAFENTSSEYKDRCRLHYDLGRYALKHNDIIAALKESELTDIYASKSKDEKSLQRAKDLKKELQQVTGKN